MAILKFYDLQRIYRAGLSGGLFDLPAGTLQLALGVQYRKEYQNNKISPNVALNRTTGTCVLGSGCSAHVQGGFNVKVAYGELLVPILKDLPFVHALDVDLGDRYSKYSTFGHTNNWKIGVQYRPIESLMLRGTVATVFRAPTIRNIFAPPSNTSTTLSNDPCDHITAPNPACAHVPTNGKFTNQAVASHQQIRGTVSGAAFAGFPIGPETGKSFDFGAVYSPSFVSGLTVSADVWRIYLKNTITAIGISSVVNLCFDGQAKYCPLITRTPAGVNAGQIINVLQPTANLGRIDVNGVDFDASYRLPQFSFGQFTAALHTTYLTQFKIQTVPGGTSNTVFGAAGLFAGAGAPLTSACPFAVGSTCFFPRIQALGHLQWQLGPWHAQWTMHYIHRFRMDVTHGHKEGIDDYGSYVYNDLVAGYEIEPINTRIELGVNNMFDKQPPQLFNRGHNANTDPQDFDVLGRFYWGRVTVSF
jgi:outer membrane receptor protein involved in Fe transport